MKQEQLQAQGLGALTLVLAVLLAGCGSRKPDPRESAQDFVNAIVARNRPAALALVLPEQHTNFLAIVNEDGLPRLPARPVLDIGCRGGDATVRISDLPVQFKMRLVEGKWLVSEYLDKTSQRSVATAFVNAFAAKDVDAMDALMLDVDPEEMRREMAELGGIPDLPASAAFKIDGDMVEITGTEFGFDMREKDGIWWVVK